MNNAIIRIGKSAASNSEVKTAYKQIKANSRIISYIFEKVNNIVMIKNGTRINHPVYNVERISNMNIIVSEFCGKVHVTSHFYIHAMIDNHPSMCEVSTYATWKDGWLNFNGYGYPGDFGDGTSVYHVTFDIYTSTRFSK